MRSKGYDWKQSISAGMKNPICFKVNPMCPNWYASLHLNGNGIDCDWGVEVWDNNPYCNERRLLILNNNPWGEVLQHNP